MNPLATLGGAVGLGFRPEIATYLLDDPSDPASALRTDLGFTELIAETVPADGALHPILARWIDDGRPAIPHGVSLGLGGADPPDDHRIGHLRTAVERLHAPLVSEHLSFVRAGGIEAGHLLPIAYDGDSLAVVVDNISIITGALDVPLAVEPVATLFRWPVSAGTMSEVDFLTEICEQTDALLLLDLANIFVNARNDGADPHAAFETYLDRLPWERVAYLHIAGGERVGGLWHDTHRHPIWPESVDMLGRLATRVGPVRVPPVLLERDDDYPPRPELDGELARIAAAIGGAPRTDPPNVGTPAVGAPTLGAPTTGAPKQ